MGVGVHSAIHLFKLAKKRPLSGSLLTLGVQDTHLTRQRFKQLAHQYEIPQPEKGWRLRRNQKPYFAERNFIKGESLWKAMGFSEISALDVSDFEDANVIFDLNQDRTPDEYKERFDVIFDGGTIEHVFHLPNALAHLHEMLKPGGLVIHQTPSMPHIDHGFYMMSPTFFQDYYSANGYRERDFKLIMYPNDSENEPSWFTDYFPGCLASVAHGGWNLPGMNLLVACAFEKGAESTAGVVPQQSWYEAQWQASIDEAADTGEGGSAESA